MSPVARRLRLSEVLVVQIRQHQADVLAALSLARRPVESPCREPPKALAEFAALARWFCDSAFACCIPGRVALTTS